MYQYKSIVSITWVIYKNTCIFIMNGVVKLLILLPFRGEQLKIYLKYYKSRDFTNSLKRCW